jgi:hypothetical protein
MSGEKIVEDVTPAQRTLYKIARRLALRKAAHDISEYPIPVIPFSAKFVALEREDRSAVLTLRVFFLDDETDDEVEEQLNNLFKNVNVITEFGEDTFLVVM